MKTKFTGCKHLDFDTHFCGCKRQLLSGGSVFWMRDVAPDLPRMVQFCKLCGRMNHPQACLKEKDACCREYEATTHEIEIPDEELS